MDHARNSKLQRDLHQEAVRKSKVMAVVIWWGFILNLILFPEGDFVFGP